MLWPAEDMSLLVSPAPCYKAGHSESHCKRKQIELFNEKIGMGAHNEGFNLGFASEITLLVLFQ